MQPRHHRVRPPLRAVTGMAQPDLHLRPRAALLIGDYVAAAQYQPGPDLVPAAAAALLVGCPGADVGQPTSVHYWSQLRFSSRCTSRLRPPAAASLMCSLSVSR